MAKSFYSIHISIPVFIVYSCIYFRLQPCQITRSVFEAWFTLSTEAKTEESLRSNVNHENGDRSTSGCSTEAETEESLRSSVNHENRDRSTSGSSIEAETEKSSRSSVNHGNRNGRVLTFWCEP